MHRLIAILWALLLLTGLCSAEQAETPLSIKVVADNEEYDWTTQQFDAQGNVRVTYGDTLLTADTVHGDPFTGDVEAFGNVTFRNGDRTLNGEHFTYNYKTSIGLADNASAVMDNIYFRGKEMKTEPEKYTITGSRFTTCSLDHPHYYLSAREMEIVPGKKLIARGVSIYLYGARLLTVPKYSVGLEKNEKTSQFSFPQIGVSGRYGAFAGYGFDLSGGSSIGSLDARISTKHLLTGGVDYDRIADKPIFARATYREPYYGGRKPNTLLTRIPELGIRFGSKRAIGTYSASQESLNLTRGLVDAREPVSGVTGVNVIGEIGAGRFIEYPDSISSERLDTRLVAWMDPAPIGRGTVFSPRVSARFSHYGTGDDYSSFGFSLAVSRKFGSESYGSFTYVTHSIHGSTPFNFDVVEIPHELAGRVGFPVGTFFLEVGGRYDLSKGLLFDSDISIAKKLHCLEPKLTWRNRFRQFSLDIGVLGF